MLIIVSPSREIGVRISFNIPSFDRQSIIHERRRTNSLVDILLRWEVFRIAANVFLVRRLVYTDIVDSHMYREWNMFHVNVSEVV